MIVVYKEIECNDILQTWERMLEYMKDVSSIDNEVRCIRDKYGTEKELIHGYMGNSVCMEYEGYRMLVVKV
ncbi:hypothetical protein [Bacillus sp. FJAT-22090]|uniref:hypothetical protein n=1 Tax=Bacillus sp. FJAT-22090 TaxID=1581038 RepID=UPI0011A0E055|nr:hypothetical protein [Bacillus sp. FJAT-22090]